MTLDATQRGRLLNSSVRECRVRLWLFDPLDAEFDPDHGGNAIEFSGGGDLANELRPMSLISPPYSLVRPGESVTLYGGDSYERGGAAATGHTWTLESGSATLAPTGNEVVVTPLVAEAEALMRLEVTATNSNTAERDAYVAASVDGWTPPVSSITIEGDYSAGGWSGRMTIVGDENSAADLVEDALLLIHIETVYDGEAVTMGGYKRANNLALVRIVEWEYAENPETGRGETTVTLGSPDEYLKLFRWAMATPEWDGKDRGAGFMHRSSQPTGPAGVYYVLYKSDFVITDAALVIAYYTTMQRLYNFTVFHDSNEFDADGEYWLPISDIHTLLKSTIESSGGIMFCNFAGSMQLIPSPSVRADEWWGTPDPVWAEANPLTGDYLLDWNINWRESKFDKVIVRGFDEFLRDVTVEYPATIDHYGARVLEVPGGYYKPTEAMAADMLAFANRDWDITVRLVCPGNVLNVGDFTYVDIAARQAGHSNATGLAYVTAIRHELDMDGHTQITTAHLVQVTNWDA